MEFFPILQDFVPCWGRYPATFRDFTISERQGKGTADLMMPFGNWFYNIRLTIYSLFSTFTDFLAVFLDFCLLPFPFSLPVITPAFFMHEDDALLSVLILFCLRESD